MNWEDRLNRTAARLGVDPNSELSEDNHQIIVMDWARYQAKERGIEALAFLYHTPNGGGRTKSEGGRMKLLGTKKGVPDLFLPVPSASAHGLWIEMKTGGGVISNEQNEFGEFVKKHGYEWIVAWSWKEAVSALSSYLGIRDEDIQRMGGE